ncbi:GPP34 family phosphoprotein [Paenibacillus sp. M1]|uniref:GPP34 family phosphoprotein n=1 Tax=Paenibacillus haidiansis TaxID=1574488 RepID=A0ABU7VNL1_9BACL
MTDLRLGQSFALVALNAQRSAEMTMVKKAALRCMAAAVILEVYLDGGLTPVKGQFVLNQDALKPSSKSAPYREAVLTSMVSQHRERSGDLKWWLKRASLLSGRKLKNFERAVSDSLKEKGLLEEIPHLLACDLYFDSAGVPVKEYRSLMTEYTRITEYIRAEILEDGPVSEETICMLWLLRESGCMHDLFSRNELDQVSAKMYELFSSNQLAKALLPIRIRHGFEMAAKQLLHMKTRAIKTPVGVGLNFVYPILERSQSVFIDTETMFPNSAERLRDVKRRLESKGHAISVLREGQVPLLKIDNITYEAVPHAIYGRVPIHGVRLLPKRPV